MPLPTAAPACGPPDDSPARPRGIAVRHAEPFGPPVPDAAASAGASALVLRERVAVLAGSIPERQVPGHAEPAGPPRYRWLRRRDRKSTRLNSSHVSISYAV